MKNIHNFSVAIFMGLSIASCNFEQNKNAESPSGEVAKNIILTLTCLPENSTVTFVYDYAEYRGDSRGITFGIIGFTSGTFDGTLLLKRIRQKNPSHPLCAYIPAFEAIDALPHTNHKTDVITGLDNFITDFTVYGNDAVSKEAQLELLDEMYYDPAVKIASSRGIKFNMTKGQIYDATVRHGEGGARTIAERTDEAVGSPAQGTDETLWLKRYFLERKKYYEEEEGRTGIINRIDILYQGILDSGNVMLVPPFTVKCNGSTEYVITGAKP
jgi:chitosanase